MVRIPPGRSGRQWLVRRLATGERAADLLDRKLRILLTEQVRFRRRAEQAAAGWHEAAHRADSWMLRAAAVGGERELRLAATSPPARVAVEHANLMGASYPGRATCTQAPPPAGARGPDTASLVEAIAAYQEAVRAAATHGAAQAALRVVDAEITATRRRLRAITHRWLPQLEGALRDRNQQLDEVELAEAARLRWGSGVGAGW